MKVIIQKDLFERSYEVFSSASKEHGIQFIQTDVLDEATMLKHHDDGTKCFVIGAEAYSRRFYSSLEEGSAVIRYGVGYNAVPLDICKERKIKVGYTPGTLTDAVAEHTFALLLGVARKISVLDQSMKENIWQGITGLELKGKTLAIIGFGQIGQAVARIAKFGFRMNVNAYDVKKIEGCSFVDLATDSYADAVQDADVVSIHMATVPATFRFINRERIGMIKDGAIFLNTARGELVVEQDLFAALLTGKLSAAGLDVYSKEPYMPDMENDFRRLHNVVLTPHCGSNTKEANSRMAVMVVKNILEYFSSGEMILVPEFI